MTKRMIIMLILVGVVLFGIFGFQAFKGAMIKKYMASMGNVPQTVTTTTAVTQTWDSKLEAVGTFRAEKGVDLSTEVAGIVGELHFDSGQDVDAGVLLMKLRDDSDQAHLSSLQAEESLAETNYQRTLKQFKVQGVSQAQVDAAAATLKSDKAQVEEQKANIQKKYIYAPFAGHLGIRNVDLGQYINPGTAIVTLQALDPIYMDFFLPQQALSQLKIGQVVTIKTDAFPGKAFSGQIAALNPKVDPSTRNIQIRAELKNADHTLLPGMYGTVDIDVGSPQSATVLPQTAITYNPYGNTVYIVDTKGKDAKGQSQSVARQQFVTLGQTRGDQVAVLSGVKAGDVIVTSGQMKLQNGASLIINNKVLPTNDLNPKPQDH